MVSRAWVTCLLGVVLIGAASCSSDDATTSGSGGNGGAGGTGGTGGSSGSSGFDVQSVYHVPDSLDALSDGTFFDHPWPSDFRLDSDGSIHLEGYPNPRSVPLLRDYVKAMKGVIHGFSPVAAGYLRFSGSIDESSLPSGPLASTEATSSVQLIDVDPDSPDLGKRWPVALHWQAEAGVYWPEHTLAFMPAFGHPLRGATRYALVVTDGLRAETGKLGPADELAELVAATAPAEPAALASHYAALQPTLDALDTAGVQRQHIVHLAAFTTNDPTAETQVLADWVKQNYQAPSASAWEAKDQVAGVMDVYEGMYGPSPDFQRGEIPFASFGDGGELTFDAQGTPVVQREFDLRFALTVPDAAACPMPEDGYPIVLYAHGTGGNYRSFVRSGHEGPKLAERCIATMGIDQIFHGTRPGADKGNPEVLFFNVSNPVAARANGPQSAIDVTQQARLFTESKASVPASVSRTGTEIRFDTSRLMFMGHSQGGLNGPMFLAVDDAARGAVLSGSASLISITLLEKTEPVDVAALVRSVFLALSPAEQSELNELHPEISLAQTIVDPTDPIHYVPMIIQRPRPGFAPKSILMTEGVNADGSGDSYAPPHGIEVEAVAMGLSPIDPVVRPPAELAWSPDLAAFSVPSAGVSGNLAGGLASGGLKQWVPQGGDGHFVIYNIPAAMDQCTGFLRNLADDPKGRLPAP
ncbi:MAG: hypothetical protein KC766_40790 [Myxococcales bacterium]|nr:hypothetical protein [Myxococcales bacterium]